MSKPENAIFKSRKPRKYGKYDGNRKSPLEAAESRKAQKDNEKLWRPENQKKSHRKPEKVGISYRNPKTEPPITPQAIIIAAGMEGGI